jgi:hypothetical protein
MLREICLDTRLIGEARDGLGPWTRNTLRSNHGIGGRLLLLPHWMPGVSVLVDQLVGHTLVGETSGERIKNNLLGRSSRIKLRKTLSSFLIKPKERGLARHRYVQVRVVVKSPFEDRRWCTGDYDHLIIDFDG